MPKFKKILSELNKNKIRNIIALKSHCLAVWILTDVAKITMNTYVGPVAYFVQQWVTMCHDKFLLSST